MANETVEIEDVLLAVCAHYRKALEYIVQRNYTGAAFVARQALTSDGLPDSIAARITQQVKALTEEGDTH